LAAFEALRQRLIELDRVNGITPIGILDLPAALHGAIRKMLKSPLTLSELASELSLSLEETRQIGDLLVDKGFLQTEEPPTEEGTIRYQVHFARMRSRNIPLDL
jgi:hypothetical protein